MLQQTNEETEFPKKSDLRSKRRRRRHRKGKTLFKNLFWQSDVEYILSGIAFAIGLGNFWTFPYLCYQFSGGAFLIPCILSYICLGIPFLFIRCGTGQFVGYGVTQCYSYCYLLRNIWMISSMIEGFELVYYVIVASWALRYFFSAFMNPLPWKNCLKGISSQFCMDFLNATNCQRPHKASSNGTCYDGLSGQLIGIWNKTLAQKHGIKPILPAEDYMKYVSLGYARSPGLHYIGPPKWDILLSLIAMWILLYLGQYRGIRTAGKIVYISVPYTFFGIILLLITGLSTKGGLNGITFFFAVDLSHLATVEIWIAAIKQSMFSIALAENGFNYLSASCRFTHPVLRSVLIFLMCDLFYSILSGVTVFSFLGVFAEKLDLTVPEIVESGIILAFVVFPQALSAMPISKFFNLLFFFLLLMLAYDTIFVLYSSFSSAIKEFLRINDKNAKSLRGIVAILMVLFSLCMTTEGGIYLLIIFNNSVVSWNAFIVLLLTSLSIGLYGPKRLCNDFATMLNERPLFHIRWNNLRWFFIINWMIVSPISLIIFLIAMLAAEKLPTFGEYKFPTWSRIISDLVAGLTLVPFLISMMYDIWHSSDGIKKHFIDFSRPSPFWRPAETSSTYSAAGSTRTCEEDLFKEVSSFSHDTDKFSFTTTGTTFTDISSTKQIESISDWELNALPVDDQASKSGGGTTESDSQKQKKTKKKRKKKKKKLTPSERQRIREARRKKREESIQGKKSMEATNNFEEKEE